MMAVTKMLPMWKITLLFTIDEKKAKHVGKYYKSV